MKTKIITILLACLPFLSSCKAVTYYEFTHEPTASMKQSLWESGHENARCLKDKDLVLIPDFRTFSSSFSVHDSTLIVCSKADGPFWIEKAVLRVVGEDVETTLNLSEEFPFERQIGKSEYQIEWIPLFDDENTEYAKYKMKERLELELHYAPSKNDPIKTETFTLELAERHDLAWPT